MVIVIKCVACLDLFWNGKLLWNHIEEMTTIYNGNALCLHHAKLATQEDR